MWRLNNEKRTLFFFFVRSQLCVFGAFCCSHSSFCQSLRAFILLFPCFSQNLPLFSLSPHLASLPHLRADECGEVAAYGCSVWLAACRVLDRQHGDGDKSVRGSAQFYPSTAPKQRQIILSNTKAKSTAFERRLCSCRRNAPKRKLTNTLLRRVMDTTAMSAPGTDSA